MKKEPAKDSDLVELVRSYEQTKAEHDKTHKQYRRICEVYDEAMLENQKVFSDAEKKAKAIRTAAEDSLSSKLDQGRQRITVIEFELKQRLGIRELKPALRAGQEVTATLR